MNTASIRHILFAVVLAAAILWPGCGGRSTEEEDRRPSRVTKVGHDSEGNTLVVLTEEARKRAGLETVTLRGVTHRREIVAYGFLDEDPSRSYSLRAPITGVVAARDGRPWPAVGEKVTAGEVIGSIQPRFAPPEAVSLQERSIQAQADMETAQAGLQTAEAAYQRARVLNTDDKNVSDRALQEAGERLAVMKAKLAAARQTREATASALNAGGRAVAVRLEARSGGEVIELLARPGEDVQAGSPMLRLARFDDLLARVVVTPGESLLKAPSTARIVPVGLENLSLAGKLVASVPNETEQQQGWTLLYRVQGGGAGLRPGRGVTAYLPAGGASRPGVIVPRDAAVRFMGMTFVYVERGEGQFARLRLPKLEPAGDGYFVQAVLKEGDRVVSTGAEILLSEEMKGMIQTGEEE